MKTGFVGIIGRPNVGKSTLLNAILGEKVSIATDKPQTTRNTIRGILTDEDGQIIFLDTPGIHKPKNKLGAYMTGNAVATFKSVDVILFLVDEPLDKGPGDRYILNMLKEIETPKILVINKMDIIDPETYRNIYEQYDMEEVFDKIVGVSSLNGINVDVVVDGVKEHLEEGPMYFPSDSVTDHPARFIVSEIIREKLFMYLNEEVPYGVAVEIEEYKEIPRITSIGAVIYCEKKSHKGIIIGKDGRKLKGIGKSAREDIEALLGCKVFIKLWVKVKENWRDRNYDLSNFGYKDE